MHKTYIYGAVDKFEGQLAVLNYKNGITYKNLYTDIIHLENQLCIRNGTMGIITGYTGLLQTIETIKIVLGLNKKCKNFFISHNLITMRIKKQYIYLSRSCINSSNFNEIKSENNTKIVHKHNKYIIIDLRTINEFEQEHINGSINIPLSNFKRYKTIQLIQYYVNNKTIGLYCDQNQKSTIVSHILNSYHIQHLIINKSL